MNKERAKLILGAGRPAGQDDNLGQFRKALHIAADDPQMTDSLAIQRVFDRAMARALKSDPIPEHLKACILHSAALVPMVPWWRRRVTLAAAACLIGVLFAVGLRRDNPSAFQQVRQQLIQQSWEGPDHLDFVSSDFQRVRRHLSTQGVEPGFEWPPGLEGLSLVGCRVLDSGSHKIGFICLADGLRHMHLFVMDRTALTDPPSEHSPQFEQCNGWKTVSWSQSDKTYMLTGMSYLSFVRKFRKDRQWVWI